MVAFFLFLFSFTLISCEEPIVNENTFTVMDWNVQALMDDKVDGSEFEDFNLDEYSEESYRRRLKNACDVIDDVNADVVILEEIENSNVLKDMMDMYLSRKGYIYYGAVKEEDSAIAIGFISKIEAKNIRVHSVLDSRNVLAIDFDVNNEKVRIFACHGKSQIEGFEATEKYRINLSTTLKRLINESPDFNVICVGDFNEDPSIYSTFQTALYNVEKENAFYFRDNGSLLLSPTPYGVFQDILYSPQLDFEIKKQKKGTYVYNNDWFNFDLILINNRFFDLLGLEFSSFHIYAPQKISTSEGIPYAWNEKSLTGISDHFPIYVTFKYFIPNEHDFISH